jgi:hypothetical protein
LATPQKLEYNFRYLDVQVFTNGPALRQVRAPDCLVNITTNTAYDYRIDFHYPTNILGYNSTSNFFDLKSGAAAFQTITVTNVPQRGNQAAELRVFETRN